MPEEKMNESPVLRARTILEAVTPLRTDCGRLCGAACCESLEGEETGMLLFPGEEALYPQEKLIRDAAGRTVLVCDGVCRREERPLSCRLFPLLPVLRKQGIAVEADARAGAVCPLSREGLDSFSPAFTEAVAEAGKCLAEDEACRCFLQALTGEQDELNELRRLFRGGKRC